MKFKIEPNDCKFRKLTISSGCDEYPGMRITLALFKWYFILSDLPQLIQPYKEKVEANWDAATVKRLGRNFYYNVYERKYGVTAGPDNFVQVHYGRQTMESNTTQNWSCFLPWGEWKFVRKTIFTPEWEKFFTYIESDKIKGIAKFDAVREQVEKCPKDVFLVFDYDGEQIEATTHIEEMEWTKGDKWCSWLKYFYKPMVRRRLEINFNKEVGPKKGSWKGGLMGTSTDIEVGETPESAFKKFCKEHNLEFIGNVKVAINSLHTFKVVCDEHQQINNMGQGQDLHPQGLG